MRQPPALHLGRHPAISTVSLDEARETYAKLATPITLELVDRKTPFAWRSNRVSMGSLSLSAHQYGGAFRATAEVAPDHFAVSFPLSGVGGEATAEGRTEQLSQHRSTRVSSPSGRTSFELGTRYRGLQLVVGKAEMLGALGALGGITPGAELRFETRLSLAGGVGATLERLVTFAVDEAERHGGLTDSPLVAARFADTILACLLNGQPHNYSEALVRPGRAADPRHLRVTAEYLEANAARPIRMTDLARVAGVSVRALQQGFLKHRGCSPMEFLRARRLELARARLLASGGRVSVATVARECGFLHLGRFSSRYRARFGERPSDTRAKAR